ncbi:uncharacterized protein V1518DRAFT_455349 [Limtongia smithiae]|uniref:uncharacterized protein n=1 Tax=Limtongia smithiae TaxID=1125753 RepID=UPI0034CE52BD
MGSIALLTADVTSLLSETKRRHTDLRQVRLLSRVSVVRVSIIGVAVTTNPLTPCLIDDPANLIQACDKSLLEIKSLASALPPKSEKDVLNELSKSETFATPFFIACGKSNVKYTSIAIQSIQRLVTTNSLNKDAMSSLIDALQEASSLGVDIQLKILQSLPPLIEKYGGSLGGDLLARTFELCSTLQHTKTTVVVNTAAATLQQLSIAVFDEIIVEDGKENVKTVTEVPVNDGKSQLAIKPAAYDAFRVFQDVCFLTEGNRAKFLKINQMSETFGLELMESIISNHASIFNSHPEQTYILRTYVFPYILRSLSERREFPITVRVIRILYLIFRRHLPIVPVECEVALSLLIHTLDADVGPYWKRVLVMEVFQGVFAEYTLVRKLYSEYDSQEGRQHILRKLVGAINKLSCEKPTIIGLRRMSSLHFVSNDVGSEQVTTDGAPARTGIFGTVPAESASGLSMQSSPVRVLCIDQLDKVEPPAMPDTYLYYLSLTCINSLADGMTRFLLPLSLSESNSASRRKNARTPTLDADSKEPPLAKAESIISSQQSLKSTSARRRAIRYRGAPINPLTLEDHSMFNEVQVTASIINDCWPALLAAFSTFLYAKLDSELYHGLVRSFQKFTQSAGLLLLVTPRDAFLTTLAKVSVPAQIFNVPTSPSVASSAAQSYGFLSNPIGHTVETLVTGTSRESAATTEPLSGVLHVRNLLCLRALLNLAIALGPTLKESWSIIIETLQQADFILHSGGYRFARQGSYSSKGADGSPATGTAPASNSVDSVNGNLSAETNAVDNAMKKLVDCTRDFPDDAFVDLVTALCKLSAATIRLSLPPPAPSPVTSPSASQSSLSQTLPKDATADVDAVSQLARPIRATAPLKHVFGDPQFAIKKLGEIAELNINRLVVAAPEQSGWTTYVNYFIVVSSCRDVSPIIRVKAAEVLNSTILAAIVEASSDQASEELPGIQKRCLQALEEEMYSIIRQGSPEADMELTTRSAEAEVHTSALNTLRDTLDRSGSSMSESWELVFSVITSFFVMHHQGNLLPTTKLPNEIAVVSMHANGHGTKAESEKISKLVKAAFSSLQLICNDFMTTIPQACFIPLIDLLYYFCHQQDDLNISFTTITFFWTVSDFLRSRLTEQGLNSDMSEKISTPDDLFRLAKSENFQDSTSSFWLILLLRLTVICADSRSEVRNGAIQILFRIFDSYGHLLGMNSWSACLRIVLVTVMEVRPPPDSPLAYVDKASAQTQTTERKQWSETMTLIVSGLSRLYSTFFYSFLKQPDIISLWQSMLDYLQRVISLRRPEIIVSVFKAIADILQSVDQSKLKLPTESLAAAWNLWSSQEPIIIESEKASTGVMTQESLAAYVTSYIPLYVLLQPTITLEQLEQTFAIIRSCLLFPELPPYFSDMDYPTPLQSAILEVLKCVKSSLPMSASLLLRAYGEFSSFAYRPGLLASVPERKGKSKKPTYIAVSTRCFDLLLGMVEESVDDVTVYADGSLAFALQMLVVPIREKYNCPTFVDSDNPSLTLWMLASNVFIKIVNVVVPKVETIPDLAVEQKIAIWTEVVHGTTAIVKSNAPLTGSSTDDDEKFDVNAFKSLETLLVPYLGDRALPESIMDMYIHTLFDCSFIYIIELADEHTNGVNDLLESVFSEPLIGSTDGLDTLPRQNMSYVCFDSLFDLSRVSISDTFERQRLAESTIPYLLLRCALVLHKFAADQPLRGTIPAPRLQQRELVYILTHLLELSSTPQRGESGQQANYKPLLRLLPLLSKSIVASKGDSDVLQLLQAVFEQISKGIRDV